MNGSGAGAPAPVSPNVIEVSDLDAVCRSLGLAPPADGATTVEVELLPDCVASLEEAEGTATAFAYVCTPDLGAARQFVDSTFGTVQWGPDTVDPQTLRLRGCVMHLGDLVIDAVHCPRAETQGVPCHEGCSPFLSFE